MELVELFNSFQGEGKHQGRNSLFIRFPNCSLCCTNCDSPYASHSPQITNYDDKQVFDMVDKAQNIVFTGGEPLLPKNQKEIKKIVKIFPSKNYEVETNGTQKIIEFESEELKNFTFNISPKTNFDQIKPVSTSYKSFIYYVQSMKLDYTIKFLFNSVKDFNWIKSEVEKHYIPSSCVYLQPKSTEPKYTKHLLEVFWNDIVREGWNISPRLHIMIFGNKRSL